MVFEEKTLSSEMIYRGAILNLRKDKVTVKDSHTSYREIVEHSGGVLIVAVAADGKIPMVRQFRKATEQVIFELPAGKLDPGETDPLVAAKRELHEETGYTAAKWTHLVSFYTSVGYSTEMLHTYLAEELTAGDTDFDENEAIDLELWEPEALYEMIDRGEIIDGKTLAALLLYRTRQTADSV
ncbi:MAG: NUDIX hydrolase [Clostridiales bacterium]|nr:NUDIX hydrolase [Clostridiales bacterium]